MVTVREEQRGTAILTIQKSKIYDLSSVVLVHKYIGQWSRIERSEVLECMWKCII